MLALHLKLQSNLFYGHRRWQLADIICTHQKAVMVHSASSLKNFQPPLIARLQWKRCNTDPPSECTLTVSISSQNAHEAFAQHRVSCAKNVNDQRARSIVPAWTLFKGFGRERAFCEAGNSCNSCLQTQKTVNSTRCTTRPKTIEGPRYFLGFLICLLVFWCKFLQFFFVYLKFCHSELENVIVCLSHFWKI